MALGRRVVNRREESLAESYVTNSNLNLLDQHVYPKTLVTRSNMSSRVPSVYLVSSLFVKRICGTSEQLELWEVGEGELLLRSEWIEPRNVTETDGVPAGRGPPRLARETAGQTMQTESSMYEKEKGWRTQAGQVSTRHPNQQAPMASWSVLYMPR
jgi:hypothetical protein